MTYEGLRLKVLKYYREIFKKKLRKELKSEDFTIISNNCWGGMIYESYGIKKMSPTVGMFFMAEDYLEFLSHLDEYLKAELRFIKPENSKWKDENPTSGYPLGVLNLGEKSVEIFFLHYN